MKRLLAVLPLALVVTACGTGRQTTKPILSHTTRINDVPLRLDVAAVHRVAGAAAVDLRLANRGTAGGGTYSIDDTFSDDGSYDTSGVALLDQRTGRQSAPLAAGDVDVGVEIAPGGTQTIRTVFPAPRGDKVGVLVPHFGLFRNVPVG
jgi:hypothetical protein